MARQKLPNRRMSETITVSSPFSSSVHYLVSAGFVAGAANASEIFIGTNRPTSAMAIAGIEIATLISIALQHGASIEELAGAMPMDDKGKPEGVGGVVLNAVIKEILA